MNEPLSWAQLKELFETAALSETKKWRGWPARLREASTYAFLGGGKRVRPVLSLAVGELFGAAATVMPWALAVELIHTYSLVHDDLPAMDDDDFRRGRPTCHKAFDEGTAVLVGDALLTRAFECLADSSISPPAQSELFPLLAKISGGEGMVGGQIEDLYGSLTNLDDLVRMQQLKTGALLAGAATGAAILSGAPSQHIEIVSAFGQDLGLLFQLTDDILDRVQDEHRDANNFFHHLSETEVFRWREELTETALNRLSQLPGHTQVLSNLVLMIASRET